MTICCAGSDTTANSSAAPTRNFLIGISSNELKRADDTTGARPDGPSADDEVVDLLLAGDEGDRRGGGQQALQERRIEPIPLVEVGTAARR